MFSFFFFQFYCEVFDVSLIVVFSRSSDFGKKGEEWSRVLTGSDSCYRLPYVVCFLCQIQTPSSFLKKFDSEMECFGV